MTRYLVTFDTEMNQRYQGQQFFDLVDKALMTQFALTKSALNSLFI